MLFYEEDNSIILLTNNSLLVKCSITFSESLLHKKTKLSIPGNPENTKCCWAGNGLLAIINEDDVIRLYNLETDRSYFLNLSDHFKSNLLVDDIVTCIDYSFRRRILFAGTKHGKVYLWKNNTTNTRTIFSTAESWEPFSIVNSNANLNYLKCSNYMGLVSIKNENNEISMLSEIILQKKSNSYMKIIQTSQKSLEIIVDGGIGKFETHNVKRIEMKDTIKGLEVFQNRFLYWNGQYCYIYDVREKMVIAPQYTLKIKSNLITFNEDSVISAKKNKIEVFTYENEKKNEIVLEEKLGDIKSFNTQGKFLLVTTKNNFFAIYNIQRRELKIVLNYRPFEKEGKAIGEIREAVIDSFGKKIIFLSDILINSEQRVPDTSFYIFNVDSDQYFDFEISKSKIPVEVIFDVNDNRVFGVYTEYAADNHVNTEEIVIEDSKEKDWVGSEFYMFFHTVDYGIKKQESHKIDKDIQGIFGICLPDIYFIINTNNSSSINNNNDKVYSKSENLAEQDKDKVSMIIKDNRFNSILIKKFQFFAGMPEITKEIKNALIDFSILMSAGKIDEAYKIVKNIKNKNIWENVASVCIRTKRLDVLEICLSNMRFSIGIKALRESSHEKEIEVRLALVAMHLGMIEQAKALLEEVKRFDILIRFYISIGEYDKAIDLAKTKNRINLENTYYRIAQHNERNDNIDKAMEFYQLSQCGNREIPRMLIAKGKIDLLEKYMSVGEDINSLHWWAAYLETNGQIEKANTYYEKAKDWANVVRIHLAMGRIDEAKKITDDTKDQGACFLMGKYYESIGDIQKAIYYYALSGRINQAFRLAKDHNMDAEIYNLGLKANAHTQNLIAEYFEKKGDYEKAINLYILARNIKAAMNLCLQTNNYEKLNEIAEMIELQNDPDALRKLAEYFVEQKQYEKALNIYIKLKDWDKCLFLCENYKITISTSTANTMLNELNEMNDSDKKEKLTLRLAKQLKQQGEFEIAHNIYVKYGDLKRAMKCLILLGNKDKVINFANTCRQNDLYILAANFLQSLDWTEDTVKNIVTFLSKAKAWTNLSSFYEMFASVEISEYRNYNKALELYDEALKIIVNKLTAEDKYKQNKEEELMNKIKITKIYANALSMSTTSPQESLRLCNEMLNLAGVDHVVKEVDIYTLMLEIYLRNKDYDAAYSVLEVLRTMNLKIVKYVEPATIELILKSVGKIDQINVYTSYNNVNDKKVNVDFDEDEIQEEL